MQELIFKLTIFSVFVLAASNQPVVEQVFLEKEVVLDLSRSSNDHQVKEWMIETDPNHIFYFSFLNNNDVDEHQIASSLIIMDGNEPDSAILFPSEDRKSILSPFYSTGNEVSVKFDTSPSSPLNGFRLKLQKAVNCPFNLGSGSSCGRVVDDQSCYCALYTPTRTWAETKAFCEASNMSFVALETYQEDFAVLTAFAGSEPMWVGASDSASEGSFVWDSTEEKMVPGYVGWHPGYPTCECGNAANDCVMYETYSTGSAWRDYDCTARWGGICESQPS